MLVINVGGYLYIWIFQDTSLQQSAPRFNHNFYHPKLGIVGEWVTKHGLVIPTERNSIIPNVNDWLEDGVKQLVMPAFSDLLGIHIPTDKHPQKLLTQEATFFLSSLPPLDESDWMLGSNLSVIKLLETTPNLEPDTIVRVMRSRKHCLNTISRYSISHDDLYKALKLFAKGEIDRTEFCKSGWVRDDYVGGEGVVTIDINDIKEFTYENLTAWE